MSTFYSCYKLIQELSRYGLLFLVLCIATPKVKAQEVFWSAFVEHAVNNPKSKHDYSITMFKTSNSGIDDYVQFTVDYYYRADIMKKLLQLQLGFPYKYVHDIKTSDQSELRPNIGLRNQIRLRHNINWITLGRYEYRFIFYNGFIGVPQKAYRFRLSTGPRYQFGLGKNKAAKNWESKIELEYYFVQKENYKERFSNLHEWTFGVNHTFKNKNEIDFNIIIDRYFNEEKTRTGNGLELNVGYVF